MPTGNYRDPTKAIYRFLTDDGLVWDGTNADMNVDGSSTAVPYYFLADADCFISRLLVFVQDDGVWTEEKFASLTALTNGMDLVVTRNGATILDLYGGHTVKNNAEWGAHCYDVDIKTIGSGDTMLVSRFTFAKSGELLLLRKGDTLTATVSDALQTLVDMHHMIQGYYI